MKERLAKIGFDPMPGTSRDLRSSRRRGVGGVGSGDSTGEHQDRLTLMAPSNQTAVLRPPKKEGAEISSTPDGTEAERAAKTDS